MNKQKLHDLRVFAAEIRLETLKIIGSRGFGHVGGSMSMADAMAVLKPVNRRRRPIVLRKRW